MPANIFSRAWPAPTSGRIIVVFNANRNDLLACKAIQYFAGSHPVTITGLLFLPVKRN